MPLSELVILFRVILAVILGSLIGYERERVNSSAGLRTNVLVCTGAAALTLVSLSSPVIAPEDVGRVIAGIVTGIGFLGAGAIINSRNHVHGLTTAAAIWVVAGVGVAIGTGAYFLAILVAFVTFLFLEIKSVTSRLKKTKKRAR